MIDIQCPETVDNFVNFTCNVTMLLLPRTGFKAHNVTVTIGTFQPLLFKASFNTSSTQITADIGTPGNYTVTAYERNYNITVTKNIIINYSNICVLKI